MRGIPRLKCDLNYGLPMLSVLGFIYTLWSINYFMLAVSLLLGIQDNNYKDKDNYLFSPIQNTLYLLSTSTTVLLYLGFKNSEEKLIRYWHFSKLADSALVLVGAVSIAIGYGFYYWPLFLLALFILGAGWYLITTIQQGHQEIGIELKPITVIISTLFQNPETKSPPGSDNSEKTQGNLNSFATSTLRVWGFLKIFQIIIISPGIVLIIIYTNSDTINESYDYWNIFWYIAGLGLYFILCLKIVWKSIPKTESNNENNM